MVGGAAGTGMAGSKKFRDVAERPDVSFVIDDLATTDPWAPRGIEVRGHAEARTEGGVELGLRLGAPFPFEPVWILIRPRRILAWGIDTGSFRLTARDMA
ncbi:hypothetical protein [Spongiactinospora gelatinilytica]|uniref:hypothetical protein n=1 Tax=Spongiactinospora gelatinilytica TaxID=2666298 RepID=UPI003F678846